MAERPGWDRQFSETSWERGERQRKQRLASRCPHCSANPPLGYPHKPDCKAATPVPRPSPLSPAHDAK